jgi:tetratricopeptide (TPR) repeat protein
MAQVESLMQQALQARREHRLEDAKRDWAQAVELCRAESQAELARALTGLAQIESDLGNGGASLTLYEEAAGIYRAEGNSLKLAHTIRHVADIHRRERRYELAHASYTEALSLYREHPEASQLDLANALRGFAILQDDAGRGYEARALWQAARELYASVYVEAGVAESTRRLERLGETAL